MHYRSEAFLDHKMRFVDEKGDEIDISKTETDEQEIATMFIDPDSVVLELGARYGTVSCAINKQLRNPRNQVSVEPDKTVWDALEKNRIANECQFSTLRGFISNKQLALVNGGKDGYAMTGVIGESDVPSFSLDSIEQATGLKFDTLVADCEGCLESFFEENPHMYQQLKMITFEHDMPSKCNYNAVKSGLLKAGFVKIHDRHDFHTVWKKGG